MNYKDYTLGECLSATGLRSLPKAIAEGDGKIWLNAIVLVSKGGLEEYCLAANDGYGKPKITRDFGACRVVSRIVSVHPTETFGGYDIIPPLKTDKAILTYLTKNAHDTAEIEALLSKEGKSEAQIQADRNTINKYVIDLAMRNARAKLAERERVNKIKSYKENGNEE